MNDGTDCTNPANLNQYIENYSCSGTEATERMLKDMRLSFPSGHASFGFYTMVFCAVRL
jgi:phosphatidate phosphatase